MWPGRTPLLGRDDLRYAVNAMQVDKLQEEVRSKAAAELKVELR